MGVKEGNLPRREIRVDTEYWIGLKVDEYVLTAAQAKDPKIQSLFHGRLPIGKPEHKDKATIVMRFVSDEDKEDYRRVKKFGKTRGMERLREQLFGHSFNPSIQKRLAFAEKILNDNSSPIRVKIKAAQDLVAAEKKGLYHPKSISLKEVGRAIHVIFLKSSNSKQTATNKASLILDFEKVFEKKDA
jgi:hypothetical protein